MLEACWWVGNTGSNRAAGLYVDSTGDVRVVNSTFADNAAEGWGACIASFGTLRVLGCSFDQCTSVGGGGTHTPEYALFLQELMMRGRT